MTNYLLSLEAIGDDRVKYDRLVQAEVGQLGPVAASMVATRPRRPWVAEIVGIHPLYRFERRFLRGNKDYSRANSIGSRGVYLYYQLMEGRIYEVNVLESWSSTDRYFCRVRHGRPIRLTETEVVACLSAV